MVSWLLLVDCCCVLCVVFPVCRLLVVACRSLVAVRCWLLFVVRGVLFDRCLLSVVCCVVFVVCGRLLLLLLMRHVVICSTLCVVVRLMCDVVCCLRRVV